MPLTSFGSILTFAEKFEIQDMAFYSEAVKYAESDEQTALIESFIKEGKKLITIVQRTRRENVTEMILEPIQDFIRAPFCTEENICIGMSGATIMKTARRLEQRSIDYYNAAAIKIKALPEVAVALKLLAKKHTARLNKMNTI
jgi:rubrerythrin